MHVQLFTTGGTFDKVYSDALSEFSIGKSMAPEILREANVSFSFASEGLVYKDSLELTDEDRAQIRSKVAACPHRHILITHGTDTMEDSAFFLNLTVKTDKPVVMVGSMRPSTAVSADGPLNLYNAVGVAADPAARGRGVLVVMNDWIHGAHSLTKTSTTAVQTFMSPLRGLVGVANYGKNDFFTKPSWKHTTHSEFNIDQVTQMPRVDIIYASADMSSD